MTIEASLRAAILAIVGRCYPDAAPQGAELPYATYQQVGGRTIRFLRDAPTKRNARMQVNVWATTREEASTLMRAIESALVVDPWQAEVLGALVAQYEPVQRLYGAQQDFSVWWE